MVIYKSFNNPKLIKLIKDGGIGAIPTDTIYGLVCSASDKEAVEKLYEIKERDTLKPLIILISNIKSLATFGIVLSRAQKVFLDRNWPGKVSVILPSTNDEYNYLSRDNHSLTFRIPADNQLLSLLQKTGPLVAPSANPQGKSPATNIDEVFNYFVGKIDFAVEGIVGDSLPSTLVDMTGDDLKVLRQGEIQIIDLK